MKNHNSILKLMRVCTVLIVLLISTNVLAAQTTAFTIVHQFGSQANNGRIPYGVLVPYNGYLYGTTTYGGPPYNIPPTNPANKGNVFRMKLDGSDFTILHIFAGGSADGWKPWSGLVVADDTIYGSTVYGGPFGEKGGVLYALGIDGKNFRILHTFGEPGDGFGASTSPTMINNTLYGITRWGGNGSGTVYSYNTVSQVYSQLHSFASDSSDGNAPLGTMISGGDGFLYGLTWLGGVHNMGTLFRIKPDGSSFETLHDFSGGTQGKYPYDSLVFDGKHTLYGTTLGTYGNDPADLGTIFKFDLTNSAYTVLHKFTGGGSDSGKPNGGVVLSADGQLLYGTTHGDKIWGGKEYGIIYQMKIDGTDFKQLYEFTGGMAGDTPMRTPLLINDALYGMTAYGGAENYGTIYRYQISSQGGLQIESIFKSAGSSDGWILESGENTNRGGFLDRSSAILFIGDDKKDRQYRSILSFNTSYLPDNANITSALLKIKKQGLAGTDPFTTHGALLLEINSNPFGSNAVLQTGDFSAAASVGTIQEQLTSQASGWFTSQLNNANLAYINSSGITQFRLLFAKDDNDDLSADILKFYTGDASSENRPQLIVTYFVR